MLVFNPAWVKTRSSPAMGTLAGLQFPAVVQLELAVPVQVRVAADIG
jgi:hypothetical protein